MQDNTIDIAEFTTLVPIKALSPDHCRELAAKSTLCQFSPGQTIFQQGEAVEYIVYVMTGEVELLASEAVAKRVKGGSRLAKLPLEQGKVYQHSARAATEVTCVKVDPDALDIMLSWDQSGGYEVQEIGAEADDSGGTDWMAQLLQAKVFRRIPPANIQSVFMRMRSEHFRAGEDVIRQGEEGEHFYIIREGRCRVTRKTRKNPEGMVLATLGVGDNFGEEALISGGKRNASVSMETDGVLMSLSKTDFLELLNEPLLKWVPYADARAIGKEGGLWIDVRLPAEYQTHHIKGSINIPLPLLRFKLEKLAPDRRYIIYCDTGRRSSIAAYLLSQNGFDAYVLQDSLEHVPASELD
jgi:CRP-like cAMP-binding protein/rhodanese-related sulfurtransferase